MCCTACFGWGFGHDCGTGAGDDRFHHQSPEAGSTARAVVSCSCSSPIEKEQLIPIRGECGKACAVLLSNCSSTAFHCVARVPFDIETSTFPHRDLGQCYRCPSCLSKFPRGWQHRTRPSHRVPIAIFRSKISNRMQNERNVPVKDLDRKGGGLARLFEDWCAISIRNERAMVAMATLLTLLVASFILWKLLPRYVQRDGRTGRKSVVRRWTKLEGAQ